MRSVALLTCALLWGTLARPAGAQDSVLAAPAKPDQWKLAVDLGFNVASGNSDFSNWHAGIRVMRLPNEVAEFEWTASFDYGRNRGVVAEKRITSGAKFDYLPQRTVSPFTFANVEQDEIRQIDLQAYGGAGLKYTFWKSDAGKASISGALVYNYETFITPTLASAPLPSEQNARWSLRFKGTRKFGPALELDNTTFFQPVMSDADNYNVSAGTMISSKATARVSLFLRHLYRRDSTPVAGVKQTDQRFSGGLRVEF